MPIRTTGGVFNEQILTGSLAHYVVLGADFSGAINEYNQPVPNSAAEIIFTKISEGAYINIMNPNESNLSFALEAGRSVWDEISLTTMVQSLGSNVGVDNVDCTLCTVKHVPYIWGNSMQSIENFTDLLDTPDSYTGNAGLVLVVNATEDGLVFAPPAAGSNAFSFVTSPSQPTLTASGASTLALIPGSNVVINTNSVSNSVTISSTAGIDYIPVPAGTMLSMSTKYFVTAPGTVTLPPLTGFSYLAGRTVIVTKPSSVTVNITVGHPSDIISTDLGNTATIEFDASQECTFVHNGSNVWELQIGSAN